MKKILFLHGFFATGNCPMALALKEAFKDSAEVFTPDLPLHPKEALKLIRSIIDKEHPDLLLGNSCGAFLAQMLAPAMDIPALLGNPHFKMTEFLKRRIGVHEYKAPRRDGNQQLVIDEALIEEFAELEAIQFDGCTPYYRERVWGLFGEQDTLAHFAPVFLEHYNNIYHFPGNHTPTELEVKTWYAPLAAKMLMKFSMNKQDKDPMAWEVLESEYIFKRPWLTARREHVKLPTGAEIQEFYVLEYPAFCNVIAITKEGKFLMERQYRHAQHLTGIEIPAGCVEEGEEPMEAAKRELYEETGYAGGEWSQLMTISPNPGACTNYSYSFLAVGVEPVSTQHLEESEDIKIVLLDRDEVIRMLKNDEFHQAMMAAPLWKYFAMNRLI